MAPAEIKRVNPSRWPFRAAKETNEEIPPGEARKLFLQRGDAWVGSYFLEVGVQVAADNTKTHVRLPYDIFGVTTTITGVDGDKKEPELNIELKSGETLSLRNRRTGHTLSVTHE